MRARSIITTFPDFGIIIKAIQEKLGISNDELAEILGTNRKNIDLWEAEIHAPQTERKAMLEVLYEMAMDDRIQNEVRNLVDQKLGTIYTKAAFGAFLHMKIVLRSMWERIDEFEKTRCKYWNVPFNVFQKELDTREEKALVNESLTLDMFNLLIKLDAKTISPIMGE